MNIENFKQVSAIVVAIAYLGLKFWHEFRVTKEKIFSF
jgi:hypothetical protein